MSEALKDFGIKLKKAREAKGLTQTALAEMVGIVPQYVTRIENNERIPSMSVFYKLVRACNLPVEELFYPDKVKNNPMGYKEKRLVATIRLCPDEYFTVIESSVEAIVKSLISLKNKKEINLEFTESVYAYIKK